VAVVNESSATRRSVDFAHIRSQITIEKMLAHLNLLDKLRPANGELRGPCPFHAKETNKRRRHFAVNPEKNVFQCFSCDAKGNHLDLWAKLHDLPIYEAALNLVETFTLEPSRSEKRSP
jgi:DNA primase